MSKVLNTIGKQQSKVQSKTYADNVRELNDIVNIPVPGNEDKLRLHSCQMLSFFPNLFFQTNAKGAFIRS